MEFYFSSLLCQEYELWFLLQSNLMNNSKKKIDYYISEPTIIC